MTPLRPIQNTRRALFLWSGLLAGALILVECFTFWLAGHAQSMREKDYHTYLAAAARMFEKNSYSLALVQVDEAVRLAPDAPDPYVVAGDIHYQLKNWDRAVGAYRNALARGSRDEGARVSMIWSLIELKRYDQAIAAGKEAVAEGFQTPAVPRYVAEACCRAGRPAESVPYFEKAVAGYPNDSYLLDRLRQAYLAAGQPAKAEQVQTRITDIETSIHGSRI